MFLPPFYFKLTAGDTGDWWGEDQASEDGKIGERSQWRGQLCYLLFLPLNRMVDRPLSTL